MGDFFDDSVLDDPLALDRIDPVLRSIAEAGARVRRQAAEAAEATEAAISSGVGDPPPRAIVAAGPDSRLLRAVLEPWCPVPFVAWPNPSLPGWAGALDLVLVLAPVGSDVGHGFGRGRGGPPRVPGRGGVPTSLAWWPSTRWDATP